MLDVILYSVFVLCYSDLYLLRCVQRFNPSGLLKSFINLANYLVQWQNRDGAKLFTQ